MSDDRLSFAPETETRGEVVSKPWKVLVADDDEEVHVMSKLALDDYVYLGQPIEFLDSYDVAQTLSLLRAHPDVALVLLDVVMDQADAGLRIVEFIRETLGEKSTRIILRTGEPGSAPEKEVIRRYDINDYKEKTELTATKLYTAVHTSIKSYCDSRTIRASREGFNQIISEAADLYRLESQRTFVQTAITQFSNLMQSNPDVVLLKSEGDIDAAAFFMDGVGSNVRSIAGTGRFELLPELHAESVLGSDHMQTVMTAFSQKRSVLEDNALACAFSSDSLGTFVLLFDGVGLLDSFDHSLINVFLSHICRAMENNSLHQEILDTQFEVIHRLGEVVEFRSSETSAHVERVAHITRLIAQSLGYPSSEIDDLALASVLHDLGKIAIPDQILNKPGRLTAEEFEEVMEHTRIGHSILEHSSRRVLKLAATIALDHHEKWDGSGYPRGKRGTEIADEARIVAIADVYDALRSERAYKRAWDREETREQLIGDAGRHFDPMMIEHFRKVEPQIAVLYG
ncbi:HD domain-containing phosphohydrolase [Spiribacter insolitus]|uniref:HD domain-containing phosphohydrolase n=1 Tax=Spiribacter insolitus TaxID=3122417 RepID=A0ABV3T606_9GAMM